MYDLTHPRSFSSKLEEPSERPLYDPSTFSHVIQSFAIYQSWFWSEDGSGFQFGILPYLWISHDDVRRKEEN